MKLMSGRIDKPLKPTEVIKNDISYRERIDVSLFSREAMEDPINFKQKIMNIANAVKNMR